MSRSPEKIALHHADSNAKHESFLAMRCLTFSGYRSRSRHFTLVVAASGMAA